MSAPERVRAFLTAHTEYYKEMETPEPQHVAGIFDWDANKAVPLLAADLEACLQTIDILARMLAAQAESAPEFVLRAAEYAIHIREVPDADHTAGH